VIIQNSKIKNKIKQEKKSKFKNYLEAAKYVAKIADEKKADYIKILDVGSRLVITDYFVIIGVKNTRLTKRIKEDIELNLKRSGLMPLSINGVSEGNWILMDYDDFVVHIFTDEYRLYYDLERLWRDSKVVKIRAKKQKNNASDTTQISKRKMTQD
jgi:ribosome-associated protein